MTIWLSTSLYKMVKDELWTLVSISLFYATTFLFSKSKVFYRMTHVYLYYICIYIIEIYSFTMIKTGYIKLYIQ